MSHESDQPLGRLEEWDEFVAGEVYPIPGSKARDEYRNYATGTRDGVREFYRLNHRYQTYDFVLAKKREYLPLRRRSMSPFEALDYLNTLVDDSDPDIELGQLQHLLQTSEAIRRDGHEEWFVLTGLLHDLGKVLCLFGEPQWAVVGDTFPVGCQFSDRVVYSEFFAENPDVRRADYQTPCGIYARGCGLANVHLSWGHDEYMYHVVRDHLPEPALYMIRYHSFYGWHREGQYDWLCNDQDRSMMPWVLRFNEYDLYSKCPQPPDWQALRLYYADLCARYLPRKLQF